jgi:hypothetical protein
MIDEQGGAAERVDVYEAWWNKRKPTRAWAARYDDEDRYDRVRQLVAERGAKLREEQAARRERERLERQAHDERLRARRFGFFAAAGSVIAIAAVALAAYTIHLTDRADAADRAATSAAQAAVVSAKQAAAAEQKAAALRAQLVEQRVHTMAAENAKLQVQRNIAQGERDRANVFASLLQSSSEGGDLGRMAEGLWSYGDQRVAGLLGADAYALDQNGLAARESLLNSALLPGALGATALPPWDLGAIADHGRSVAVLAGARQSRYDDPISGSLVVVDAADLAVESRAPSVRASLMCGFDDAPRAAVASDGKIAVYDLAHAGGAVQVRSMSTGTLEALACEPVGDYVVFADRQAALRLGSFSSGRSIRIAQLPAPVDGLVLSESGRYAAVSTVEGELLVYDVIGAKKVFDQRALTDEHRDCLADAGCAGAFAISTDDERLAWYDGGKVEVRTLDGKQRASLACAAAICDHPTLMFPLNNIVPVVVTQSIVKYDGQKDQYAKVYDDIAGYPAHKLWDLPLQEYFTPYNPDNADAPNPLGSGIAAAALVQESAPLVGRVESSQWQQSYAIEGHMLTIPGEQGFISYDLDHLRLDLSASKLPSYAVRIRDSGDVVLPDGELRHDGVAYDFQTGIVRVLDLRGSTPAVIHQFRWKPIKVVNNKYVDSVEPAYDPATGTVSLLTDEALYRFTADGSPIATYTKSALDSMARVPKTHSWWAELTQRGTYIILHVSNQSDVMLRADGTFVGQAYTIKYVSPDERLAFAVDQKGTRDVPLTIELPNWAVRPGGVTPIAADATSIALSPDHGLLAYEDSSSQDDIELYDVGLRSHFRYHLQDPPDKKSYLGFGFSADNRYLLIGYEDTNGIYFTAIYALDPAVWTRSACLMAGRPLSLQEFQANVGTNIPYVNACTRYADEMYRW